MRSPSAYTESMKFWTRFVACFLIAWLPLLGYTAQAGACPEMTSSGMSRPAGVSSMTGMAPDAQKVSTHASGALLVCHGAGGLSCGAAILPATHAALDIPSLPVYRATIPFLFGQFIPEPLQPPPRTL
ncbi:hypothetical protein P0D88_43235 [Paraburkholderia sp. RL18-103-BIB-C]|uniref:hypothetical protein n=2 Tax=unclassified Paraburkholderia TaxID=2615204 RepID=UPI0038B8BEE7